MKTSVRGYLACILFAAALIAGCGGGGSASPPVPSASPPVPSTNAPVPVAAVQNVQPVTVDSGPSHTVNAAFTSVTICAPDNNANCQTIDHVQIDTGSSGLRLISSVLSPSLALPQQMDGNGQPIAECTQFADGNAWGPVKLANVKMAGELASAVPIQVIGDPKFSNIPADCANSGFMENSVQTFGANGLLGIGVFLQDCGSACAQNANFGLYYVCPTAGCQPATVSVAQQVHNPAALFAADNNGVVLSLPSIAAAGAVSVGGSLIFGIGTQPNNSLGAAKILTVNPDTGNFTTVYNNQNFDQSFIDSGSNAIYFPNGNTPVCSSGFYCPPATRTFSATNRGVNGITAMVNFSVANADALFSVNPDYAAFDSLAGPSVFSNSFDWGLPFFFGRNVFTAFEGKNTAAAGSGPYVAY